MHPIYLDHHATTPVDPAVLEAMLPYLAERFGNASSTGHAYGREAHAAVEEAREQLARLVGASAREIVFTSGATESDNLALRGVARSWPGRGRHLVTSVLEHAAVLEPCRALEREGWQVTRVRSGPEGIVDPQDVARALGPETVLVSLMAANNEVGTLQPLAEVGALCRRHGVLFHSDAVQALGRIPVDVEAWGVDLMSLSAHKMYGPKGTGALYVRRGRRPRVRLEAQALGGGQEHGLRSGTLNVPGIVGFGAAAVLAGRALAGGEPARTAALRDRLLRGLRERLEGVEVNGSLEQRLPGNLNVSLARVDAEGLVLALAARVAVSAGAACSEAGGKGSHVLRALGLSDARVYGALRFGLGRYNTDAEVDAAMESVAAAVLEARARGAGPVS